MYRIRRQMNGSRYFIIYKGNLIIVEGDTCKFGDNPEHLKQVTDMIDAKLYGLFPMEG